MLKPNDVAKLRLALDEIFLIAEELNSICEDISTIEGITESEEDLELIDELNFEP